MNRNFVQNQVNSKSELRKKLLVKRLSLTNSFVEEASRKITQKVIFLDQIKNARNTSAYLPIGNEVDTKDIIDYLVAEGKRVFLPRTLVNTSKVGSDTFEVNGSGYIFAPFAGWQNLEPGPFGILQPISSLHPSQSRHPELVSGSLDIAILPGIAFDKHGVRLGYGKGVFDRLLANSAAFKIGLAYNFQIVDELPLEEHDLVMDLVVTENRLIEYN